MWQTHDFLLDEHQDPRIRFLAIGQAGENLAKSSCVIVDRGRALGRGGAGAVMGSKNLKGVAVRGTGGTAVADPEVLVLFEDWLEELENEVVAFVKKSDSLDPTDIAEGLGLSRSGATFLLTKLQREGKL